MFRVLRQLLFSASLQFPVELCSAQLLDFVVLSSSAEAEANYNKAAGALQGYSRKLLDDAACIYGRSKDTDEKNPFPTKPFVVILI